ncbi:unnamed protein product [Allacma fusca]|uniref:Uncharacterized protein n=1 Tax=Allacma fusca TaxID=39272 RepID=A0A8J2P5H5_9HEXA|nr:unnamed protein product [Allacma fusca]
MSIKESMYSRPIAKPKPKTLTYITDIADLEQDVQEKIDYLRKKMLVTRKREKVIREESTEMTANTAEDLVMLIRQNDRMQATLTEALYSEQDTVKDALRTHPLFQMAMTNKGAEETISWLEDKIFDLAKVINRLYCKMCCKKAKLDDIEMMVSLLEKYPKPGSSPYEIELQERLTKIQLSIELALYRRTTAAVLQKKYKEVKDDIEAGNGQYEIILKEMEKKIEELYSEQQIMSNILCVATQFQKQKQKDLRDYEKAYNTNYKIRRAQLKKKRKQTEDKLEQEERNAILESHRIQAEQQKLNEQVDPKKEQEATERKAKLKEKLEIYRGKLNRLQDIMRVENINKVVTRMRHVVWLAYHLQNEAVLKTQLNRALEKQRNNLLLLKCHMKYSGFVESRDYNEKKAALEADRLAIDAEVQKIHEKMHKFALASHEGSLGILTLLKKLGDRYKGARTYKQRIKTMFSLMENLKDELISAREEVSDPTKEKKPFLKLLKPHRPEKRLVRVGTPPPSDADDDIDDAARDALTDRMVPGRAQMKERSERFMKRIQMKKLEDLK